MSASAARSRLHELAFAAWMLVGVALSVVWATPWPTAVAGVLGLGLRTVAAAGRWTPSGRLGLANLLTLARLGLVAALPACAALPRVAYAGVVFALWAIDGLDGWLARVRGDASPFGAALDMEVDALSVMLQSLVLWRAGVGGWVLVAGVWRYAYAALIAVVPTLGEAPRSWVGRAGYGILCLSFVGAAACVPGTVATALAALGTVVVSASFGYSLARSKAVTSSDAASAQLRAGGRRD